MGWIVKNALLFLESMQCKYKKKSYLLGAPAKQSRSFESEKSVTICLEVILDKLIKSVLL